MEKKTRKAEKKQEKEKKRLKESKISRKLKIDLDSNRGYYRLYFANPYRG